MKRSLTTLCLLLCLGVAAAARAQDARATATPPDAPNANTNTSGGGAGQVPLVVQSGEPVKIEVGRQAEPPKGLNPLFKDWVDVVAKLGTPISLIVAVILAWQQIKKNRQEREKAEEERTERQRKDIEQKEKDRAQSELNRQQREQDVKQRKDELRWRKAQLAREMLKELHDNPYAVDMMTMLDWNGREFSFRSSREQPGRVEKISWEEMWAALRITERNFNDKEKFVRDCADAFFGRMQTVEHYLTIDLIDLEDVVYPFEYYLYALSKNPTMFDNFIETYHPRAASFIGRLKKHGSETDDAPPEESDSGGAAAYFMFDCPPGDERFCVRLEDPSVVSDARAILGNEYEWHLTGDIVTDAVYYNAPWEFHVAPASVRFVQADLDFAHRMNEAVEAQTKRKRAVFQVDNVWHTGGARLLAELPASWFDRERDGQQDEERHALRGQARVAGDAEGGSAAPPAADPPQN